MDTSSARENCSVYMNEQMGIFREKCQKESGTSKNIILSATFIKILTKKSQLVWGTAGKRDVQELRLGWEPKNFWAEHTETTSIFEKSMLCFLQQGPLDVSSGPSCSVVLFWQVGFISGWGRKLRSRQCKRASVLLMQTQPSFIVQVLRWL